MAKLDSLTNHVLANLNTSGMNANREYKLTSKDKKQVKHNIKALQSPKLKKLNTLGKAIDELCNDNMHYDKTHKISDDMYFQYDAKGKMVKHGTDFSRRTKDAVDLQSDFNNVVTHTVKYNPKKLDDSIGLFREDANADLGYNAMIGNPYMFVNSGILSGDVGGVDMAMPDGLKNAKHYQNKYAFNHDTPALNKILNNKSKHVTFNQLFNAINHTHGCHAYFDYNENEVNTDINFHQNTDYHGWPMFGGHGGAHKVLFTTIKMPNSSYDLINMLKPNQAILGRNNTEHVHNDSFPKASTNDIKSESLLKNKVHTLVKRFAQTPLKDRDFKHFPNKQVSRTMDDSDRHRYNYMKQDLKAKHTKHQLQATAKHAIDNAFTATAHHDKKALNKNLHTIYKFSTINDDYNKALYLPKLGDSVMHLNDSMGYLGYIAHNLNSSQRWHQIAKNLNKYMKPYASKNSKDAKALTDKLHTQKILAETKKYTKQLIDAKKHLRKLHQSPVLEHHLSNEISHQRPTTKKVQTLHHVKHSDSRKLRINRNQGLQR